MSSERRLAGILLAASAGYLVAAFLISEPEGEYATVGPRAFPVAIGLALAACALRIGLRRGFSAPWRARWKFRWRGTSVAQAPGAESASSAAERDAPAGEGAAADWRSAAPAAGAFLVYIALLAPVGYLLATAVFIPVEARLLGSRSWRRDVIAGLVITAAIYAVLGLLLGLRLPAGVLD